MKQNPRVTRWRLTILLAALCLAAAGAANIVAAMKSEGSAIRPVPAKETRLAALLGQNNFARRVDSRESEKVRAMIGANEICDQIFDDGAVSFEMYAAYWRPGNTELREAYGHIPDACWSLTGWECTDGASGRRYNVEGVALRPAEWRKFVGGNQRQEVVYWCLIGERAFNFRFDPEKIRGWREHRRTVDAPVLEKKFSFARFIADSEFLSYWNRMLQGVEPGSARRKGTTVSEDTYFIRLNSEHPIEALLGNAMFREQVKKLAALGLAER